MRSRNCSTISLWCTSSISEIFWQPWSIYACHGMPYSKQGKTWAEETMLLLQRSKLWQRFCINSAISHFCRLICNELLLHSPNYFTEELYVRRFQQEMSLLRHFHTIWWKGIAETLPAPLHTYFNAPFVVSTWVKWTAWSSEHHLESRPRNGWFTSVSSISRSPEFCLYWSSGSQFLAATKAFIVRIAI